MTEERAVRNNDHTRTCCLVFMMNLQLQKCPGLRIWKRARRDIWKGLEQERKEKKRNLYNLLLNRSLPILFSVVLQYSLQIQTFAPRWKEASFFNLGFSDAPMEGIIIC